MDLSKKTNLAKARKNVQEKKAREERDLRHATKEQFEAFIGDLGAVLAQGVRVEGLGDVDSIVCRIEAYGQDIADLVGRIVECTAAIPNLDELRLPDTIELKTVTDPKLLDALEKVGDDGLLLEKFKALDETLILLSDALTKDQTAGQTEEDYQPVRIVLGREGSLKFLENWPTPVFSGGGGSGGTSGGLTDAQLRASPVPVSGSVTVSTTGLATDSNQTSGAQKTQVVDGAGNVIGATSNALDVNIKSGASAGTQYTEDAAAAANPVGTALNMVRDDARSGSITTADGDNIAARGTNAGELYVKHVDAIPVTDGGGSLTIDGTVTANTGLSQPLTDAQLRASAVPVSAAALPLPSGAATSANQQTDALTDTQLRATPVPVSGTITATVSGVSTAAKQDTIIGHVDGLETSAASIDTKTPALGQALAAASTPVVLTAAQEAALTPPAAITGFATSAKQDTLLAELQLKADLTETQPVSAASLPLPSGASTAAKQPALGTAGSASTDVITIQGIASGTVVPISVASLPLPSGAATLAEQQTQTASLSVLDDWDESDRAKVNLIVGQAGIAAGTGVDGATVPRVTLATNVALPAGTNAIGKLAANSGVDIGDVDVTSIAAGTNIIGGTFPTPSGAAAQALSNDTSAAYEASSVTKASAGTVYGVTGYNSRTSAQFFQLFNSTTVPADATAPVITIRVAALSNFSIDFGVYGRRFSTGIAWSNSSTGATKTIGSADIFCDVNFV